MYTTQPKRGKCWCNSFLLVARQEYHTTTYRDYNSVAAWWLLFLKSLLYKSLH